MADPLLQLRGISKSFGEFQALHPLSMTLEGGEVLGVVGENGAGKSTLLKILSGVHAPDSGEIIWDGRPLAFSSPQAALSAGIATIHQELAYCGSLSVAENLLLGEPWPRFPWGGVRWSALHRMAAERLARLELDVSTWAPLSSLSAAQKQEVAIARALSQSARLLILDEPTASLTEPEVQRLFRHLRRLKAAGYAMIYVSHRLSEILELTQRVLVLRDGAQVAIHRTSELTPDVLIRDMVGRPLDQVYPRTRSAKRGSVVLEVRGVGRHPLFENVSFSLHAGEVVGLAGLVGAGRSELARALFGLYPLDRGEMRLRGKPWSPTHPLESLQAGLVYLPEERKRQGLVLEHSIRDSISIGFSDLLQRWGIIPRKDEEARVARAMDRYDVRASGAMQPVGLLSGGNQQKVMLSRWLERDPEVILLDEPTRGVDVGAKAEIHAWIDRLAAQGKAVLLISSDLPELLGLSDRVLVMGQGTIRSEFPIQGLTQETILRAASGWEATTGSQHRRSPQDRAGGDSSS